ncbi:hypothetical protein HHI36_000844 [Cryptolaemus montrouzieri]|uniref:Uncharacterized protein n=1 Tax=Cryptolaemus montrouzieri TaxID=559131 RepID=A0ABD2P609_9CUCU
MFRFEASNNYLGLEDAINSILKNVGDNKYDLIIVPPDPAAVTEEGEAEDLRISKLPNGIPGTLEVILWRSNLYVEDVEEQSIKWNEHILRFLSGDTVLLRISPKLTACRQEEVY